MVLSFGEASEDDRPPEAIWLNSKALSDHWDKVRNRYAAKANGMEPIEDGSDDVMQNPVTAGWRK